MKLRFGIELKLDDLMVPIKSSFQLYDSVWRRLQELERGDLQNLCSFSWKRKDGGTSGKSGKGDCSSEKTLPEVQEVSDLDLLLEHAEKAQKILKARLMRDPEKDAWPSKSTFAKLKPPFQEGVDPGIKTKKRYIMEFPFK